MKRSIVLFLAGALVLGACGDNGDDDGSASRESTPRTTSAGAATTEAPETSTPLGPATITAAETSLGTVIVDADGRTLYLYTNDTGTTSAVPDNILAAWPPLIASGPPVAGEGTDAAKLGTAMQPNGETWVTYNGHLLYTFTGDTAAGQTNGQGLGDVWYAVSPAGERVG
jgi:predicted lipoprotein with Yx(FWY)xxD motif